MDEESVNLGPTIDREVVVSIVDRSRDLGVDVESLLVDCGPRGVSSNTTVIPLIEAQGIRCYAISCPSSVVQDLRRIRRVQITSSRQRQTSF